jgi:hypothetical protein
MFDEACRVSRMGVVFIDGVRNAAHAPVLALFGHVLTGTRGFTHDGLISLRRFYALEELALLGQLMPRHRHARAHWIPPAHVALRFTRSRSRGSAIHPSPSSLAEEGDGDEQ